LTNRVLCFSCITITSVRSSRLKKSDWKTLLGNALAIYIDCWVAISTLVHFLNCLLILILNKTLSIKHMTGEGHVLPRKYLMLVIQSWSCLYRIQMYKNCRNHEILSYVYLHCLPMVTQPQFCLTCFHSSFVLYREKRLSLC